MTLRRGESSVKLNNKAFQLMELLAERPGVVHSIDQIMERVWGYESETEINVVWVTISGLRKRLASMGADIEIRAKRGQGYYLEETRK